ncbi:hypothetical protein ATN84_10870 [Paramesorhizobium deserti]|uniref:Uncharacterized protein n=1 Tax=Paramesorhizobium deserti TaxID=1494590 RepID=A0A135HTN1_9HYPH|nr:hypothetical protein ATN84_10870 [Paramesorhizobium deserti]
MANSPRIDDFQLDSFEISDVTGCQRRSAGKGNGGNLGIKLADWSAGFASVDGDFRINIRRIAIKRQNATCKILCKDRQNGCFKLVLPPNLNSRMFHLLSVPKTLSLLF